MPAPCPAAPNPAGLGPVRPLRLRGGPARSPPISTGRRRDGKAFAAKFSGRLASLSGDALAEAFAEYERIEEVLGRAMSYGQLVFCRRRPGPRERALLPDPAGAGDGQSPRNLLFFTLELNRLEDAELEEDRHQPGAAALAPLAARPAGVPAPPALG
jgi:oligoendopeptidase F